MLKTFLSLCFLTLCLLAKGHAYAACIQSNAASSDFPSSLVETRLLNNNTNGIVSAWYDGATDRYRHGVLGDEIEPSILAVSSNAGCAVSIELDEEHVFEDIAPRLANVDNKPGVEIITVRSHQKYGAQVAVYHYQNGELKLLATTPYIGTANRWLAPVGIADLNNDGDIDIAFVDRPHLAKVLRVWSYQNSKLVEIASKSGFSNHKIGEDFISGGIKACGDTVTMITADASWQRVLETSLEGKQLVTADIGVFKNTDSLTRATLCN